VPLKKKVTVAVVVNLIISGVFLLIVTFFLQLIFQKQRSLLHKRSLPVVVIAWAGDWLVARPVPLQVGYLQCLCV
jgi:hypothetical protein